MEFRPANADEIRSVIASRLAARSEGSTASQDSLSIDWREGRLSVPVIQMPVDLVYYNPHTRRIRAQRDFDIARSVDLESDPYGSVAQGYLEELLQWDPAKPGHTDPSFEALLADLREHGQNEAGLIAPDGVLINGNTRRAALKKIGRQNIFVGVLPNDTSRADLDGLELALQLRKTHKRDYSFVNELLAIDERVKAGVPTPQILKEFRMKQDRFNRSRWLLNFIDDAIRRSETVLESGEAASLHRYDFERDQGQLEELYRAWSKLEQEDRDRAAILRDARLVGVVLDLAKTDLRVIGDDFVSKYVAHRLPNGSLPEPKPLPPPRIPGLDDIDLPSERVEVAQIREFADAVLKAAAVRNSALDSGPIDPAVGDSLASIRTAYLEGRREAGADADYRRKGLTPADRLQSATDNVEYAVAALAEARATATLDVASFEDALQALRSSLLRLAQVATRIEPSEEMDIGFEWLRIVTTSTVNE